MKTKKDGRRCRGALFGALWLAGAACAGTAWGEWTSEFELDTRGAEGFYSRPFELDTRDADTGVQSVAFELDTRGQMDGQTGTFELDTRGPELGLAPRNLAIEPLQPTEARASWEYDGTPLGFWIERREAGADWAGQPVGGGETRAWTDETVESGQFYEYRVAATYTNGVSAFSETAYVQMPTLPAAPIELEAACGEELAVALAWKDASRNEDGFEIWRKEGAGGEWARLAETGANATGWVDRAVAEATPYAYKARAFNRWGHSGFGNEAQATTPAGGEGCGFELRVDSASLELDGREAGLGGLHYGRGKALLKGRLDGFASSPKGYPHPIRAVLGYRDARGRAVGKPRELVEFYSLPGCPGETVRAEIPDGFMAPAAGTNGLWLEMILAQRDPVVAFQTERHTQESPMRKKLFDVAIRTNGAGGIRVRALEATVEAGETAEVPVQAISDGGEILVEFSATFGEGLAWEGVAAGADAEQARLQATEGEGGAMGIRLEAPRENPLGSGTKHVATLRFRAEGEGAHAVSFGDAPTRRSIVLESGETATVEWEDGLVEVVGAGLEGDVHPRPCGDGIVDEGDVAQATRYLLGVEEPIGSGEFRRLDCAPEETCGDGKIDVADVVAIRRIAAGDTATKAACGPTNAAAASGLAAKDEGGRAVGFEIPAEVARGETFWAVVALEAQGGEHGLGASIAFDPEVLAYRQIRPAGAFTNGAFLPNAANAAEGVVAFCAELGEGETVAAGRRIAAEIQFEVQPGAGMLATALEFASEPTVCGVSGIDSRPLEAVWRSAETVAGDGGAATAPPPPEVGWASAIATNRIQVTWGAVARATGYRVRRKVAGEAGWTRLADYGDAKRSFVDDGLPTGTRCDYLVSALNPHGAESGAIRLWATTWTALEAWRQQWFGRTDGTGAAADGADPDGDDMPNLLEYRLGTEPLAADPYPYRLGLEEVFEGTETTVISYALPWTAPGGLTFEFAESLVDAGGEWRSDGVSPVSRRRVGEVDVVKLRLPGNAAERRMLFVRLKAE